MTYAQVYDGSWGMKAIFLFDHLQRNHYRKHLQTGYFGEFRKSFGKIAPLKNNQTKNCIEEKNGYYYYY